MRKLSLLLTLFGLLACRSPQEATQTVIRIHATESMQERIKAYKTEVFTLPKNESVSAEPKVDVTWPVKRTFVPESESSSHRFRYVFTALDEADVAVTTLEIETEVVQGASRYLYILLNDDCLADKCDDGVCKTMIGAAQLRTSPAQAQGLEGSCSGGSLTAPPVTTTSPADAMAGTGDDNSAGSNAPTGNNTSTGTAPPTAGAAADGGTPTTTPGADAGPVTPPSTVAACSGEPCGSNGECHLNSALPKGYECKCTTGFEPDETASTCVTRNDCLKPDKGGCEDLCEVNPTTGEGICSCDGPNRWLKADGKQCAEVQDAIELTTSGGSVDRTRPQVAFDAAGNGVVAWTETSDAATPVHTLWTARFQAESKEWAVETRPFVVGATDAADLHLALDQSGSGILIWTATVNTKRELWYSRYRNGSFSSLVRPVTANNEGDLLMPSLAIDAMGDGLVVWTDMVYPVSKLRVARYLVSTDTFSEMENIAERANSFVFGTSVAVHGLANGLVAWTDVPVNTLPDAGPVPIFADSNAFNSRVDGSLGKGIGFTGDGYRSTSPDVVMDAQGNGVGVWIQDLAGETTQLNIVAGSYAPGDGWALRPQTLSDQGDRLSAPRVVMGTDGSAFAAWRETTGSVATSTAPSTLRLHTHGSLRVGSRFGSAYELGLPSDAAFWDDINTAAWTPETTVTLLDSFQPGWSSAVGPNQTGFIVGAAFTSSATPAMRQLWLQRIAADQEPAELIRLSSSDAVPSRPSPVRLSLNANGDGAVVWDRQIDGRYHVFVNVLD